jgi:hypothetical protein
MAYFPIYFQLKNSSNSNDIFDDNDNVILFVFISVGSYFVAGFPFLPRQQNITIN